MSEPETPLETARRLWPGEWEDAHGCLRRRLLSMDGLMGASVALYAVRADDWRAEYTTPGRGAEIARGTIDHVVTTARDHVQSMARDFAHAAGVDVAQ